MIVTTMVNQRPAKVQGYVSVGKRVCVKPAGDGKVYIRRGLTRDPSVEPAPFGRSYNFYARTHVGYIIYYGHGDTIEQAVASLVAVAKQSNLWLDNLISDTAPPEPERVVITLPMVLERWLGWLWHWAQK